MKSLEKKIDVYSWNINGLRSAIKKGFIDWFKTSKPSILCLQEIRANELDLIHELKQFEGYTVILNSALRKGYSGIGIISIEKPIDIILTTQNFEFDYEGRFMLVEFQKYAVLNCYVPNGRGNIRLDYKVSFLNFLETFIINYVKKPLIICGDFNIAHKNIDLHNPISNKDKSGCLPIERLFFDTLQNNNYVDVYRYFFPNHYGFTWWNQAGDFKKLDLGWRFDYIWIKSQYINCIDNMELFPNILLSDHCPLRIEFNIDKIDEK